LRIGRNKSMYIKTFSNLNKNDIAIAGGKGASLGEMTKTGINVPPGFVVLTDAFNKFLNESNLEIEIESILKKIEPGNIDLIENSSKKIMGLIKVTEFPKDIGDEIKKEFSKLNTSLVAVRSSATAEDSSTASWAGELESYLNIDESNLLKSVKKCWSSLFTPRAVVYRIDKGMEDKHVSVAVVVQKMIQSEISGITFTVHPVTKNNNDMIIEAGYGLGEAIVGGMITPDTYIVDKNKNAIVEKNISEQSMMIVGDLKGTQEKLVPKNLQKKQKMSDREILKLAGICKNIEKHYNKPQDIEWALEKGILYITQSRPITTL